MLTKSVYFEFLHVVPKGIIFYLEILFYNKIICGRSSGILSPKPSTPKKKTWVRKFNHSFSKGFKKLGSGQSGCVERISVLLSSLELEFHMKMGFMDWLWEVFHEKIPQVNTDADALLDTIVYGGHILKNPVTGRSVSAIMDEIRGRVYLAESDFDRIKLAAVYFSDEKFIHYLDTIDLAMTKHEFTASSLKKKFYHYFGNSNDNMALRCSNLALLFTPSDSDLIPYIFADRALYLYRLNDWVGMVKAGAESLALTQDKVHGDLHSKIESAGNYVSIVEHPVKGRMLVVTQDIGAGTTVIVEQPFVRVKTASTNWELTRCAHCYKKTRATVPCPDCIHTTYCSAKCRLADFNSIHKYECNCLNYFHAIDIPWSMQLGFRAISKTGPEAMFKFFNESNDETKDLKNQIRGVNPKTGRYDSDYLQIYHLISHPSSENLEYLTWYALSISKLLALKTTFYDQIDTGNLEGFMKFIAAALLRHSVSIPYNTMTFFERPNLKPFTAKTFGPDTNNSTLDKCVDSVGIHGVFALSSLICHSCDASAVRAYLEDGTLAIVTSRKLKAGDEITIAYGCEFFTDKLEYRSKIFVENLGFKCECVACVCEWPIKNEIGDNVECLCPNCSHNSAYEETNLFRKCVLSLIESESDKDMGFCVNCKHEFKISTLKENVMKYEKILQKGKNLLVAGNPLDALPIFVECIEFFESHVLSPFVPLIQAQSLLSDAHESIVFNSCL